MAKIESAFLDIGALDTLACGDSPIHRLDPRVKVLATFGFVVCIASFDRYEVSGLLPFFLFPAVLIAAAGLPLGFLLKKLLLVAPFAVCIGMFNPFFDPQTLIHIGTLEISGGWVSFASILLRFALTIGAALVLIATTSFPGVCMALEKLGTPRIFAVQLLLLYRYLFVLVDEGLRLVRARSLRSFHGRGKDLKTFGYLTGQLLLRTLDRAQRIHLAMLCRGFTGDIRMLRRLRIGAAEAFFLLFWWCYFALMRIWNIPQILGDLFMELSR